MNTQASTLRHNNLLSRKSALLTFLALATALLGADQPGTGADFSRAFATVQSSPQIAPPPTQPASFLAWDADSQNYDAKPGELGAIHLLRHQCLQRSCRGSRIELRVDARWRNPLATLDNVALNERAPSWRRLISPAKWDSLPRR
jgi:hypothetical protein